MHYVNNISRIKYAFLDIGKRRLTYLLANNQITSNINQDKNVEYTKLDKKQNWGKNLIGLT